MEITLDKTIYEKSLENSDIVYEYRLIRNEFSKNRITKQITDLDIEINASEKIVIDKAYPEEVKKALEFYNDTLTNVDREIAEKSSKEAFLAILTTVKEAAK